MTKKKKFLIWFFVLVAVGGGIFFYLKSRTKEPQYVTEKVTKGTVSQTVSVTGELVSDEEISLNFEITGRLSETRTKVGEKIAQGETVAVVNQEILSQDVLKAKAAFDKAVADAGASNDTIREARQAVENAEDYLDAVEDAENQKVDVTDNDYKNKSDYYDDALSYYNQVVKEEGEGSAAAKSAKLTLMTAENNKKSCNDAKETARDNRDLALTSAENSLNTAKEQLKTAESKYARESRDASVEAARIGYETAQANLEKSILKAPVTGTITALNFKKGEVLGVFNGDADKTTFGTMIADELVLESNVPESDIVKLKTGQSATVVFDSLPEEETFNAEIIQIDPASTVIQDVVYYQVKLRLENADQRLKAGMSADIDVHVAEKQDVLMIPQRAVKDNDGSKSADVLRSDKTVENRQIKTGLRGDEGMVEVISGLKEGEEVVTLEKSD